MEAWRKDATQEVSSTRDELGGASLIMDWQSPRNKKWIRTIAIGLIVCFVNQDIVWAQSGTPIWTKTQAGSSNFKPLNVNASIAIPKDVAITKEVFKTVGDKTIINIQDAHDSLTAQESISAILDSLVTNYDMRLIAIEGGQEEVALCRAEERDKRLCGDTL